MGPLQTNEALLAHLVQNSPIAIVVSEFADGLILDVNDGFLQLAGYSRDEVIGQTSAGLGLWADPEQRTQLQALLMGGQPVRDFEAALRMKSGAERLVCATVSQIEFDGRPWLLSQLSDITAQRHEQLQFRALVEQIPVVTYVGAPNDLMTLTYISPQCEAILGYSPDEVLAGQPSFLTHRTHPEDTPLIHAAAEQARRTSSRFSVEYRLQTPDDRWIWLQDEAVLVRDPQGRPLHWQGVLVDVTARKAAEDALRHSEERFRALVHNSYDVVVVLDSAGTRTYISPSIERLLGHASADLLGRSPEDLVHPDDVPLLAEAIESCLRGVQETPAFELRLRHRNGSWHDFEVIGTNLLEEPSVGGIVFNSREITTRKAAETALRESEERFRAVWDATSEAMALAGLDGIVIAVNPAFYALYGLTPEQVVGQSFVVLLPEETRVAAVEQYHALFTDPTPPPSYEWRVQHTDGSERFVEARLDFLLRDGERVAMIAVIRDVTEQHVAISALRESEQRFRSSFDHAPIGMALVALDGRFLDVNRALCELVGYTEQEMLGKSSQDIVHPDDLAEALELRRRLATGEIDTYQLEKRYVHKDGHIVWILLTGSVVHKSGLPFYIITHILDITDRRRLEMDRAVMLASEREYNRQLRALTEMRADLTAMVAHELRAPVSALRMMTILLEGGELSPQDEAQMFSTVKGEIEQLDRLVNDIAAVTVAEREDFSVQLHPVSLALLLEGAEALALGVLADHDLTVLPAPETLVWCDPERISQVLRNLLQNAAKHTPPGTSVELRALRHGQQVRIEVADDGPGIAAKYGDLIFEKFGRGPSAAANQTSGAGLGLYVSRQILRAHGSDLTVESTPGEGTVFAFDLKVAS
jgi:two-component system, sensor histidine kinase and response regulator